MSVYVLAKKEKLIRIMKQLIFAYTSKCAANKIFDTRAQFNKSFQSLYQDRLPRLSFLSAGSYWKANFPYAVLVESLQSPQSFRFWRLAWSYSECFYYFNGRSPRLYGSLFLLLSFNSWKAI